MSSHIKTQLLQIKILMLYKNKDELPVQVQYRILDA